MSYKLRENALRPSAVIKPDQLASVSLKTQAVSYVDSLFQHPDLLITEIFSRVFIIVIVFSTASFSHYFGT